MNRRNIDEDPRLLRIAMRLSRGEINESQARWILGSEGYSEKEITEAFHDYRLAHEIPEKIVSVALPLSLVLLIIFLLFLNS